MGITRRKVSKDAVERWNASIQAEASHWYESYRSLIRAAQIIEEALAPFQKVFGEYADACNDGVPAPEIGTPENERIESAATQMSSLKVAQMLYAFAVENRLKGIMVRLGKEPRTGPEGHNLEAMAREILSDLTEQDANELRELEYMGQLGRYPSHMRVEPMYQLGSNHAFLDPFLQRLDELDDLISQALKKAEQ